jgi:hypothetical protein
MVSFGTVVAQGFPGFFTKKTQESAVEEALK